MSLSNNFATVEIPDAAERSVRPHSADRRPETGHLETAADATSINVFVHLAHGYDVRLWNRRWRSGELIGINEPTPYGYGLARERLSGLAYSTDRAEGPLERLLRLGLRAVLGFDLLHALANRRGMANSDVIWTHTESQFLAVAFLSKFRRGRRPSLIGQSIWLFDRWDRLSAARRVFYRWLITNVDVLTVHSPENLAIARHAFPLKRSEVVLFGIATGKIDAPRIGTRQDGSIHILAVGNDRHRDWSTAVEAVAPLSGARLTIVSATAPEALAEGVANAKVQAVRSNETLQALYDDSDLVLVPLRHNCHASGITVLQEAAVKGLPAIASDTGGLRAYFGDEEVAYVPVGDVEALRRTIEALRYDEARRRSLVENAQRKLGSGGLSSRSFVERHLEISRSLTAGATKVTSP